MIHHAPPRGLDYHHFLVQHIAVVDKLVRFVARRHHLSTSDQDEFASLVRFKLVDRDFAILRKFQHRSSINTYLAVVIERQCLDFCIAKWGKWRPSAAARRLGDVAIQLEQLLGRDGITFDEAVGTLQTNHGVSATRAELHAIFLQLPAANVRHPLESLEPGYVNRDAAGTPLDHQDDELLVKRVQTALIAAYAGLAPEDRQIVRLRFETGLPVVDIARALDLEVKPLYRRLEQIILTLRADLLRRGIHEHEIARVVGHPRLVLSGVLVDDRR